MGCVHEEPGMTSLCLRMTSGTVKRGDGGVHRVVFYGDHISDVTSLGKLLGFRVVRED